MHLPFHPWDLSRHDWALPSWLKTGESSGTKVAPRRLRARPAGPPAGILLLLFHLSLSSPIYPALRATANKSTS